MWKAGVENQKSETRNQNEIPSPKPKAITAQPDLDFPSGLSLDSTELIEVRVEDWF